MSFASTINTTENIQFLLPFSSILNRIISNFVHFNMTLLSYRWSKRLREHESNKFEHRNRIIRMLEALISLSERGMRTIDRRRKFTRTAHASRRANGAKYGEQGGRHWMQIGRLRGDHVRHPCAESVSFLLLFSSFDYSKFSITFANRERKISLTSLSSSDNLMRKW